MAPLLYACEFDRSGYAVAARRYLRALKAVGHPVSWQPLRNTSAGCVPCEVPLDVPPELAALPAPSATSHSVTTHSATSHSATSHSATTMLHCIPHSWPTLRPQLDNCKVIGQTVWEAEQIPRRWHRELAVVDEIWVPTQWNAEVIRASGIEVPVHVVPHVIDTAAAEPPPIDLDPSRFVLLAISTWDWRKRPDLLLHAYLRAFTADDAVTLVLKTGERILSWNCRSRVERFTWWQVMQIVRQYPRPAEVVLVTEEWSDAEIAGLHQRANCYVSLTCSEGWGLGAFDAAVAGVPVIITGHGGQLEWLGTDHPGLLPYTMVPVDHPDLTMFEDGMSWAIADVEAASEMMRATYEGSSAIIAAAPALADRLTTRFSEDAIGRQMVELLS